MESVFEGGAPSKTAGEGGTMFQFFCFFLWMRRPIRIWSLLHQQIQGECLSLHSANCPDQISLISSVYLWSPRSPPPPPTDPLMVHSLISPLTLCVCLSLSADWIGHLTLPPSHLVALQSVLLVHNLQTATSKWASGCDNNFQIESLLVVAPEQNVQDSWLADWLAERERETLLSYGLSRGKVFGSK